MAWGSFDALTGTRRYGDFIVLVIFIVGMGVAFYLGSWTTNNAHALDSQLIYNQGLNTGKALGVQQTEAQNDRVIRDLVADCKEWYEPFSYRGVNLTETARSVR